MATNIPITSETLITVKVSIGGSDRKFKIPLRDLGAASFPDKLKLLLALSSNQKVLFERFSDSAGTFVALDPSNPQVYKQLYRAAKAKLKLRIKTTVLNEEVSSSSTPQGTLAQPNMSENIQTPNGELRSVFHTSSQAGSSRCIPGLLNNRSMPALIDGVPFHNWSLRSALESNNSGNPPSLTRTEVPFARPSAARDNFFNHIANATRERELALRMEEQSAPTGSWSVYCNNCDKPMADAHFHCSVCDDGDYDLCEGCVENGSCCPGEGHWLIKRFVRNGRVINSTTERLAPRLKQELVQNGDKEMPGSFNIGAAAESVHPQNMTRTCNCCVKELPEAVFLTCTTCEDYDLCVQCIMDNKHGHHPGHQLEPAASGESTAARLSVVRRNGRHAAICDGCDQSICGVRHKCLNCPDFDYCSKCFKNATTSHRGHRFVPVYEPLPAPSTNNSKHFGVYCDGPLCRDKNYQSYITGTRYKCAICHDTDFCANCESIPSNRHNRSHPLLMIKTPVDSVNVMTTKVNKFGKAIAFGDRAAPSDESAQKSTSTETVPETRSVNAATQVQTVADLKPTAQNLDTQPPPYLQGSAMAKAEANLRTPEPVQSNPSELQAIFVSDIIRDGTKLPTNKPFLQTWILRNPGPEWWPAGCSVRFVGGDAMLNLDESNPSSVTNMANATESSVIGCPVGPGETVNFTVLLKAPKRAGKAISYWRLKTCDGVAFGHKLWCDIDVFEAAQNLTTDPSNVQVSVAASSSASVSHRTNQNQGDAAEPRSGNLALLEYKRELMLLECANLERLMAAHGHSNPPNHLNKLYLEMRSRMQALNLEPKKSKQPLQGQQPVQDAQKPLEDAEVAAEAETVKSQTNAQPDGQDPVDTTSAVTEVTTTPVDAALAKNEDVVKDEEPEPNAQGSQMIFPTLDKESPASSTYKSVKEASSDAKAPIKMEAAAADAHHEDRFEDCGSLDGVDLQEGEDVDEEEISSDGEWDVLDASDEEFADASAAIGGRK